MGGREHQSAAGKVAFGVLQVDAPAVIVGDHQARCDRIVRSPIGPAVPAIAEQLHVGEPGLWSIVVLQTPSPYDPFRIDPIATEFVDYHVFERPPVAVNLEPDARSLGRLAIAAQ